MGVCVSRGPCLFYHSYLSVCCVSFVCMCPGIYEALELRDKDPKSYMGKGVTKVCVWGGGGP